MKWKCHSSCPSDANGGDVIAFYMAWKGVDFKMAVEELAEWSGSAVSSQPLPAPQPKPKAQPQQWCERAEQFVSFAEENLQRDKGAQEYLIYERGLSPTTWKAFRLGYNPNNLYDDPGKWGLEGRKIWLSRGIVIPGFRQEKVSYIRIRRPLDGEALGRYIPKWNPKDGSPDVKFGGPRGGKSVLFRLELMDHLPILLLVEGEWDAMLLWEHCADLCDVATLGGAQARFDTLDLSLLALYPMAVVVHDDDKAGSKGREYIASLQETIPRLRSIPPPAHDLTDFWKSGGDLRKWAATHLVALSGEIRHPRLLKILMNAKHELNTKTYGAQFTNIRNNG